MDRQRIALLDPFLGALAPGRLHIITGATGTGKSAAALRFIDVGLQRQEASVLVTSLRTRDLRALAEHLGIELGMAIAEDRLAILRYASDLAIRLAHAGAVYGAIDELRLAVDRAAPTRLVIDSIAPFLADDGASAGAIARLAAWLDSLGATSLLTYPGSLESHYDRRLEPLVQDAAGIFHLVRDDSGGLTLETVTVRATSFAPLPSRLVLSPPREAPAPRAAMPAIPTVPAIPARTAPSDGAELRPTSGRLTLLHPAATPDAELLALLRRSHDVDAFPIKRYHPSRTQEPAAVLVETTYQAMDAALRAIGRLASSDGRSPIVAISPFDLRSVDRAQVLHAGADEFLTRAMGPAELLQRLELAIRGGRTRRESTDALDLPMLRQPTAKGGAVEPLDETSIESALAGYHATAPLLPRTVVRLAPRNGDVRDVASLAMRTMRTGGGDLAAIAGDAVLVYLHGTRRRDAVFFTDRVRAQWAKQGHGALAIDAHVYDPAGRAPVDDRESLTVAEG